MNFENDLKTSEARKIRIERLREIEVEKMVCADLSSVLRIEKECRLSRWSSDDYLQELERADSVHLVSRIQNRVTGFLIARLIIQNCEAELYNIGVEKKSRRNSAGKLLIGRLTSVCEAESIKNIWLEVRESNKNAIHFYEQNGFQIAGKRKDFYKSPDENALLMKLNSTNYWSLAKLKTNT